MLRRGAVLCLLMVALCVRAQVDSTLELPPEIPPDPPPIPKIETVQLDQMPSFPGGDSALTGFLAREFRIPKDLAGTPFQGTIGVVFFVEADGSLTEVRIARGVHPLLDAEALRVIGTMPRWSPGRWHDRPLRTRWSVVIDPALSH
jgi:TonB-like protein